MGGNEGFHLTIKTSKPMLFSASFESTTIANFIYLYLLALKQNSKMIPKEDNRLIQVNRN